MKNPNSTPLCMHQHTVYALLVFMRNDNGAWKKCLKWCLVFHHKVLRSCLKCHVKEPKKIAVTLLWRWKLGVKSDGKVKLRTHKQSPLHRLRVCPWTAHNSSVWRTHMTKQVPDYRHNIQLSCDFAQSGTFVRPTRWAIMSTLSCFHSSCLLL